MHNTAESALFLSPRPPAISNIFGKKQLIVPGLLSQGRHAWNCRTFESAFCVVCTTLVQRSTQFSHCSVYAEIKNKTWNSWEFYSHKNIKNINIIFNIIIFIMNDISPDLRDFRFLSPDHQTSTDFTRFGEKSPGMATLLLLFF